MLENYLNVEIEEIINKLKEHFSLDGLKNEFSVDKFLAKEKFEVEISHNYLNQINNFLASGHNFVISRIADLKPVFDSLDKEATLDAVDLYNIASLLIESENIYNLFVDKKEYINLYNDAMDLNPLPNLKRELLNSIEKDFTISSNASPKLKEIRDELYSIEKNISSIMNSCKKRYSSYLESSTLVFKDGQEALAVKANYKNMIKGSILSYSSSYETAYIVPYEVLDARNRLSLLKQEEGIEIIKILSQLSLSCKKQLKILIKDYDIISNFDRYLGAVNFAATYDGIIAQTSDDTLILNDVFHPLLKAKKIITNSIMLGKDLPKILLITGPNAGGKSVFIKSVAISFIMDKLGLLVPCKSKAIIPFVDKVFFLGGDNQSVLDNLSTFSSHLLGIKEITDNITSSSIVIIDEVFQGTSPKDGEALSIGLLKYLEKINCFALLTSHYDGIKLYATNDDKCISAAMEFNIDKLKPTYKLILNVTGKSYGLLLAKNLGLNKEIVSSADEYIKNNDNIDASSLIEKLSSQAIENEKKLKDLENKKKDLDRLIKKKEDTIKALNDEKYHIHEKAKEKIDKIVESRLKEIDSIWASKEKDSTYSEVAKAKGELNKIINDDQVKDVSVKKAKVLTDIKVGDYLLDENDNKCEVLEVKKNQVTILIDSIKYKRNIEGLRKYVKRASDIKKDKRRYTSVDTSHLNLSSNSSIELNIIGLTVDEAMREVVKFIDTARVKKMPYIRIIHGLGTFKLKEAVWKYLKNHPEFVSDYSLAGSESGGMGATIIHLK